MASILRQIVAGPRARHPEANLDLCYVTDRIIATSGPSGTFPQRAYRNPLDALVRFLDGKHGANWAIWEFRAEGTGYPDEHVYGRVFHYPFPDHHPPPFALIPGIMGSMRNWLHGEDGRVVVVHCKAGKGRSGTASCSYLISEEGWSVEDALARFTERRMRPGMGKGVSIPSQLRWIGYVDRWAKSGKTYVERRVKVVEVHTWGLRDGVKISVEGFVEEGKVIKAFHTFSSAEREVVRGEVKTTGMARAVQEVMYKNGFGSAGAPKEGKNESKNGSTSSLDKQGGVDGAAASRKTSQESLPFGTGDVVFRPSKRVILPTNDINIDVERRNKAAFDLTMVTAVAHVWFNAFFEGLGPEKQGKADESGMFEISWDAMDGIKGSSRKGTQAFERIAVVWRVVPDDAQHAGKIITEPAEGEEAPQPAPANWKGASGIEPGEGKDLGLRRASPTDSEAELRRSGSARTQNAAGGQTPIVKAPGRRDSDQSDTAHVKSHGLDGAAATGSSHGSASAPDPPPASPPTDTHRQAHDPGPASASSHTEARDASCHPASAAATDGKPESQPRDVKEHSLGHIGRHKSS